MREVRWIADASLAGLALWATLILAGVVAGTFAARWNASDHVSRGDEGLLLAAAAAGVAAWFANAGSLIGGSTSSLLRASVPIDVETGYRLAVLWATRPGAALTFAVALLVRAALAGRSGATRRVRFIAALAVPALVALGTAVWFTPAPDATSATIPPFVQSATAALAPLCALVVLVMLAESAAARVAGAAPDRALLRIAWVLATLAVAAEQMARSRLGIGPREAIVLGSASSGLVLWLFTSALLHRRVQSLVFRTPTELWQATASARAAHAGAILMAISFAAHALAARATVSIPPGTSVEVTDAFRRTWQLANQGVSRFDEEGADVLSVALQARTPSGATALLAPEIRAYHGRDGEHLDNTVARRQSTGTITQTMRVLLAGADSLEAASVRVTFLPLPLLWPIGMALLALSLMTRGKASGQRPSND